LKSADEDVESYIARLPPSEGLAAGFRAWGLEYRWFALLTTVTGNVAAMLAGTIINVAIPDIMGAFGISQADAQWLSTANLAAATVSMLASSWMVRVLGLRQTVNISMCLLLAGSLLGGLANNTDVMIVSRVMQGITAGVLTPLSTMIIFQVFLPGKQGIAIGVSTVGIILAPAIGPAIGGILIDTFNWRYVFYLGIPFSLITLAASFAFMPARQALATRVPFDWNGMVVLSLALIALLVGLSNGEKDGWGSDYILGCLAVALVSGAGFVWWELRAEHPLLDLGLFANRNFTIMGINSFVFGAGLFASTYLVPLFLQLVQHLSATQAGALMIPPGIAMVLIFPYAGKVAELVDHRLLIGCGIGFFAVSFWLMSGADANTGFWTLAWWLVLSRIGLGFVMPALQLGALSHIEISRLSQASAAFNFVRQLGGAFGVNLMSIALERRNTFHADYLLSTQTYGSSETLSALGLLRGLSHSLGFTGTEEWHAARAFLQGMVQQQALGAAFRDSFVILAIAFLLTLIPTLALKSRKALQAG
jgi:EmrB/QacA subfamily drug resistance transporter